MASMTSTAIAPNVVSEQAERRLDRSMQHLNQLRDIAEGAGHAAVGLINPYHKFVRRKFYQASLPGVNHPGTGREYRSQGLPDRDSVIEQLYPGWLSSGGMKGYKEKHGGELPERFASRNIPASGLTSITRDG